MAFVNCIGEFITRMDADDIMPTEKLETLHSLITNSRGSVGTGKVKYFPEDQISDGYKQYELWLNRLADKQDHYSEIYKECSIASPCWMIHREDLLKCGAFDSDIYPEDYDLVFRFYKAGLKVISSQSVLHHWRDHGARASRNDPNYLDNRFLDLKLKYFLELEYPKNNNLVLWGAGKKGKAIARFLDDQNINFEWVCNTPSKIGHQIGKQVLQDERLIELSGKQVIVAVASKEDQSNIIQRLSSESISEYFFFC